MFLIQSIVSRYRFSSRSIYTTPKAISGKTYDFIIVGGGSAGCTLALRLSESIKSNVLLIEAGPERNPTLPGTDIKAIPCPGLHLLLHQNPETDWCFKSQTERIYQNFINPGIYPYARGKGLGGSSAVNFNMWVRGTREDYDNWEKLGAEGWSADKCLPFFIKSENISQAKDEGLKFDPHQRGLKGPIGVSLNTKGETILKEWINSQMNAYKKAGFEVRDDYNDLKKSNFVIGRMQYSIKNGSRSSTDLELRANIDRPNLDVITGYEVSKILFRGHKATGVQLIDHLTRSKITDVHSKREIIVSSGSISSPRLLMISGVGPKDHLNSVGIDTLINLPGVGQNMSDHLFVKYVAVGGEALKRFSYYGPIEKYFNEGSIKEWVESKSGFLSKVLGDVVGYFSLTGMREDKGPDIQTINFPFGFPWDSFSNAVSCKKEEPFIANEDKPAQTIAMSIAQPKSRGQIRLRSSNPNEPPIIDSNVFDHPDDRATLIAAYKFADNIATTGEFKDSVGISGKLKTDNEIIDYIKVASLQGWHASGTCKIGRRDDPSAVVDPRLRVRGTDGLRVCDSSVFPVVTSGNTNAPTIMVAEKGADIIKQDHDDLFQ